MSTCLPCEQGWQGGWIQSCLRAALPCVGDALDGSGCILLVILCNDSPLPWSHPIPPYSLQHQQVVWRGRAPGQVRMAGWETLQLRIARTLSEERSAATPLAAQPALQPIPGVHAAPPLLPPNRALFGLAHKLSPSVIFVGELFRGQIALAGLGAAPGHAHGPSAAACRASPCPAACLPQCLPSLTCCSACV